MKKRTRVRKMESAELDAEKLRSAGPNRSMSDSRQPPNGVAHILAATQQTAGNRATSELVQGSVQPLAAQPATWATRGPATGIAVQRGGNDGAPKDKPKLRQEIPTNWVVENMSVDDMFSTILDVHKAWIDPKIKGVTYAVVDKHALAAEYVQKSMWDESYKKWDPTDPECKGMIDEVAKGHCPDAVTLPAEIDPMRTILVNKEKYETSGSSTPDDVDYVAANAVMMHESHHASSVGFLAPPIFSDRDLSWKFDEAVTEYYSKKAWDAAKPEAKDGYAKGSNYYEDQEAKTGWYGDLISGMLSQGLFTSDDLGNAYFKGDEAAAANVQKASARIIDILKNGIGQMPVH